MKDKDKIYLIAMIEILINNNLQTDLGQYVLEYKWSFSEIGGDSFVKGDGNLAVFVRLKNKSNNNIEWGNAYYKTLIKHCDPYCYEDNVRLKNIMNEILMSSDEDKLKFITTSENKYLRKYYNKHQFVNTNMVSFFENLSNTSQLDDSVHSTITLGEKFPKKLKFILNTVFEEIIDGASNKNIKKK